MGVPTDECFDTDPELVGRALFMTSSQSEDMFILSKSTTYQSPRADIDG